MDIELYYGNTKAIISTKGGYVTNLSDNYGDVLFPKRFLTTESGEEKLRGGSHVCLPNFGPGGTSGQEQHGYGRISEWRREETDETSATMRLNGKGEYDGLEATLEYELGESELTSRLMLVNSSNAPLRVAPAFHPYFVCRGDIEIDGQKRTRSDFKEAVFLEGTKHILRTDARLVTLSSSNLPLWAQWSDELSDYLCIEPTQSGFAFAEDMARADTIMPGGSRNYAFTIGWSSLEN